MALPQPLVELRKHLLAAQRAAEKIEAEHFDLRVYEIRDYLRNAWLWVEEYTVEVAEKEAEDAESATEHSRSGS